MTAVIYDGNIKIIFENFKIDLFFFACLRLDYGSPHSFTGIATYDFVLLSLYISNFISGLLTIISVITLQNKMRPTCIPFMCIISALMAYTHLCLSRQRRMAVLFT